MTATTACSSRATARLIPSRRQRTGHSLAGGGIQGSAGSRAGSGDCEGLNTLVHRLVRAGVIGRIVSCIDVHAVYSRIAVYLSGRLPACTARELRLTRKIVNDANTPPIASLMEARIPPLTTVANGRRPGVSAPAFRIEQPGAMARANSQKR